MRHGAFAVCAAILASLLAAQPAAAQPSTVDSPMITPAPQAQRSLGAPLVVPSKVTLVATPKVDAATIAAVTETLTKAGARDVVRGDTPDGALTVTVGEISEQAVARSVPDENAERPAEGYTLISRPGRITLAGNDSDGTFYAAQTLRQLVVGPHRIASTSIVDSPSMPLRGSIEGFYGKPWSHAARLDQFAFYGKLKMNTYIYTPKDDPYLRDQWREPYPADKLSEIRSLVDAARHNHVRFTYAVAPGLSMCYSSAADRQALVDKLRSIYDVGVRSFYISFDDIDYTKWNCAEDKESYGAPSAGAAGRAQKDILNFVQHDFLDKATDTKPLQFVPTEYSDVKDSPYKKVLREELDPRIIVQWTGTEVVPPAISVKDAEAADKVWGRKVFVWDNYPVNDYQATTGRLLMAPYAGRESGLSSALSGIVLNPMNQASASKIALFGGAAFTWNDRAYDPERTWRAAAADMAGAQPRVTSALLRLLDAEHKAPLWDGTPWQPQAPKLAATLEKFRSAWDSGDRFYRLVAVAALRGDANDFANAAKTIRDGVHDPLLQQEIAPWLTAMSLWGKAYQHTVDGLTRRALGLDPARAFAEAKTFADRAAAVTTIPGATRPQGPIKLADTVLDDFLAAAPKLRT